MSKIRGNTVGTNISVGQIDSRMCVDEISNISILRNELRNGYFSITNKSFEQGTCVPGYGLQDHSGRIRLKRAIFVEEGTKIEFINFIRSGMVASFSLYEDPFYAQCNRNFEWSENPGCTLDISGFLQIVLAYEGDPNDAPNIVPSDYTGEIKITPKNPIPKALEEVVIVRTQDGKISSEQLGELVAAKHAILSVPIGGLDNKYYLRTYSNVFDMRFRFMRVENDLVETAEISIADLADDDFVSVKFSTHKIVDLDNSLSIEGKAADAKAVGDALDDLKTSNSLLGIDVKTLMQADLYLEGEITKLNEKTNPDSTLSLEGKAADAKAVGDRLAELAETAGREVYEAKYDPENEHLLSDFQEMEAAFIDGKIVTLSANTPDGVKYCFYCTQHNTEENSGYEGATLTFSRFTANYIETLVVESGGAVITFETNLYNLKTDVDNIKEDMGDIDAALDAIIAIQNSLIGGEGA